MMPSGQGQSNSSRQLAPPGRTPHVRLNSGQDNILDTPPGPSQQQSSSSRPLSANNPFRPQSPQSQSQQHKSQLSFSKGRSLLPISTKQGRPSNINLSPAALSPQTALSPQLSPGLDNDTTRLLSPTPQNYQRYRDRSPSARSGYSSRRSSWGSRRNSGGDFYDGARSPSRTGSDDEENLNTQTVAQKYNIHPSAGLLLFPEDVEKDDYLHNPGPDDRDRDCDIFTKRGMINLGGLILLTLGILMLFVGYPVLTWIEGWKEKNNPCYANDLCLQQSTPLLKNVRQGLIDPDTPSSALSMTSLDGKKMNLVFSDEFNVDGRTFYEDDDPFWQAVDLWYGATQDLEWYDPDAITTKDGYLEIRFDPFQNHGLNYRSGMLQSWNRLCFQGGHLEASISLPGSGQVTGFWPGFWTMGNLGRPGYTATTDGMWPYSYDNVCDAGITKNQSQTDGINWLPGMRLPACTCTGEDHPTPGKSRSAPEVDVIEASVGTLDAAGNAIGVVSQSCQIGPFDVWYAPDYDYVALYDPTISHMNSYRGGNYQEAMSCVSNLNNDWYNGTGYQSYAIQFTPGASGNINWFIGSEQTWTLDARAIRPNGNIAQRLIPIEPMSMILNFGLGTSFAPQNWTAMAKEFPAYMRFDYVRIYQEAGAESVTCDPSGMETTPYIYAHQEAYMNPNVTSWAAASNSWPLNALVDGCQAQVKGIPVVTP